MAGRDVDEWALLADALVERRDQIVERWVTGVLEIVGDGESGEETALSLSELRDAIPDYLEGIARLLRDPKAMENGGGELWRRLAVEHGITRIRQRFDVDQLIRELLYLRRVLFQTAREAGIQDASAFAQLTEIVEGGIIRSVESYVEYRDGQVRRIQAQHAAFVTHELRNPLSTAMMALSHVKRSDDLTPKQRRLLDVAERSHLQLRELVDDVLASERTEARGAEPQWEAIRLEALVDEAIAPAREEAEARELGLSLACDPELQVILDRQLTSSAIQNIVGNAVKYTEEGEVAVSVATEPDTVAIHVYDQCGGLTDAELDAMFRPYQRGGRPQPGTGIGMTIAKRAVEAQGGEIGAESRTDGCHVWFSLPRRSEDELDGHSPK